MKRSPPQWAEPLDEEKPPYFSTRRPTAWHEPPQEETTTTEKAIFTFLQPKPKIASGSYRESLHRATQFSWTSAMPRFKRNRPESAVTTSALTQQKQQETNRLWIELILSLTTFSSLYISTTSSSYQDQHLEAAIKNFNSQGVRRHIQIWHQFQDWCKPLSIHPAGISIQFLLDFLYESSKGISKHQINSHSLLKSLRFIATQADIYNLKQILWSPIVSGYLSETKKPKNPREVFPFHFTLKPL